MTSREEEWAEPGLRQVMVQQIEDTYRLYGNPTQKPSRDVEKHILEKAQSRDDYLQIGARLILHIKEVKGSQRQHTSASNSAAGPGVVQAANPSVTVNTNMLSQQLNKKQQQQIVINQQGNNQNQLLQQQLLVKQIANASNNIGNANPNNIAQQSMQASHQGGQLLNQRNITQQAVNSQPQQQYVSVSQSQIQNQLGGLGMIVSSSNVVMPNQVYVSTQQQQQQVQQQLQMKQQQQQQQQVLLQQTKQPTDQQQILIKQLQHTKRQLINQQSPLQNNLASTSNNSAMPFTLPSSKANATKPTGPNMNVPQSSPAKSMPAPSPQGQPSPQMQPAPSPAFINPPSVGPAPSPLTYVDEQAYVEKMKEMSKYIEPLAKLINRMPKDDGRAERVKERNKMNGLLDMLNNKNRRVQLNVLGKCEHVLRRLFPDVNSTGSVSTTTPDTSTVDSIPTPVAKPHSALHMGEVVTNVITSAHIMSDSQQNIFPGLIALNAPTITPPLPTCRKFRKRPLSVNKKKSPLPRALQMEIVTLCNRFDMKIDKTKPVDSAGLTLLCKINDDSFPVTISSLSILIRPNYPRDELEYVLNSSDNSSQLDSIRQMLQKKLSRLPNRITVTTILNTWEQSLYDCFVDG